MTRRTTRPVFVLTHHPRDPVPMEGGTTFHFVTDGIESALAQARTSAGGGDISVAGGADTVNQFLAAGLLDILRLHVVPAHGRLLRPHRHRAASSTGCRRAPFRSPTSARRPR